MGYSHSILFQALVKPFYRENKGTLVFIFTMMFFIVSQQSGAGLYAYHYSLVTGMLSGTGFLLFVFFIWFLYTRKCIAFVSDAINNPAYGFMHIFNCLGKTKRISLFFLVEAWLLMPILLYAVFIVFTGLQQHFYIPVVVVIVYLILLCIVPALWYVSLLNNPRKFQAVTGEKSIRLPVFSSGYHAILFRFIANRQKTLWVGIKVFTCCMLYLNLRNNSSPGYDSSYAFIFFSFGILSNGVIIYRIRQFEESCCSFYRGLPVPLLKRLLEYSLFYVVLLIPEFVMGMILTPHRLHYADAISFSLCGYSLLLLMNSITYLRNFSMKDYLKILLLIFFVEYFFFMAFGLTILYAVFFISAITFFLKGYYTFDQSR